MYFVARAPWGALPPHYTFNEASFVDAPVSGSAVVTVVQASESWPRNDAAARKVWSSAAGRLLAESEMGPILVIVGNVVREESLQMALV